MIDWGVLVPVLIGRAITLIGTLLANHLQYRSEQRKFKKEQIRERFAEVRRHLTACLEFADLLSIPTTLGKRFSQRQYEEWIKLVSALSDRLESLPIRGSARVLYVEDEELLQLLQEIDSHQMLFWLNYQELINRGEMIPLDEEREELICLAKKAQARLDKLLDKV